LKPFPNRHQAKKAYNRAKPYIVAASRTIADLSVEATLYILDALKTLIIRARQEPFIFLAATATVIYAIFAYNQWNVMSGQLAEMQADRRPWVSAPIPKITGPLQFTPGFGVEMWLTFHLKNTGHSPASRVRLSVEFVPRALPLLEEQRKICDRYKTTPDPTAGSFIPEFTIFPGDTDVPFNWWVVTDIADSSRPAIVGCIVYEFTFGKGYHQTGIIYDLLRRDPNNPQGGGSIDLSGGPIQPGDLVLLPDITFGSGPAN